ncbi:autotransporter-associated beta strand repeat-containing protein [Xanthomonas sacchari]|uniref:autotransporter-associated beta strand repeat-containing protein n=1 Tax=Xanthomonas sacchari TaxID=56458 RepID=UPI0020C2AC34|nr:autotransporter-associated beta strand repeat-containing protein [Xanthomonas sacchari]
MNKIFRIVWNRALGQMVVTSEHARSTSRGGRSAVRGRDGTPFVLNGMSSLALALVFTLPAHAANLAMPTGALLDINNGSASNSASNTPNQFQVYSVNYTATSSGNNYVLFAFRQDPSYWTFGNVGLYEINSSTNLFDNPLFVRGGAANAQSGLQAPAGWGIVYQTGTTPEAAGVWHAPGTSGPSTTNVNQAGVAGSWYDGAVGSFDGIYQGISLAAGTTYTIRFTASTTGFANTAGAGNNDIELGVYAGQCVSLTGPVADCTPNNPYFTSLASPSQTQNAGGPALTVINQPTTTTTLGSNNGKFDGGTLLPTQDTTLNQTFTITDHGGTIDQAGHQTTLTGAISDDSAGTPGALTIANSGQGGAVTLTGQNAYTGQTTVNTGATLAIGGAGSIASSSGVTNNGTLDLSGAGGNVTVRNIGGLGDVALGSHDLVVSQANGGSIAGTVSGSGGVDVNGGTQVLGGNNTYTGGTRVTNATVQVSSDHNLGDASGGLALNNGTLHTMGSVATARNVVVTGNGTFNTDAGTTTTSTGTVSGSGGLVKNGAGTLDIEGVAAHSGGTTVNGGTLVLGGANTYTGGNTLNGGILQISSDANLGDASNGIAFNGGALHTTGNFATGRALTLNGNGAIATDAGTTLTANGPVSGSGGLVKNGAGTLDIEGVAAHSGGTTVNGGTLVLGGANTYTGGNTLNGGILQISSDANLGDASNGIAFNGGALHTTGNFATGRALTLNGNGAIATDAGTTLTANGPVSGSGGLVKNGAGTLDIEGVAAHSGGTTVNGGTLVLGGANTYTGGNTLNGGILQISSDANLGDASNGIVFNGGALHTTGNFATGRALTLNGNGAIATDAGTTLTANGPLSGIGGLVKNGAGTLDIEGVAAHSGGTTVNGGMLVLGGANTYTGGNTLNGGTLQISSDANLGDASNGVTFNGGNLTVTNTMSTTRGFSFGPQGASITTLDGATLSQQGEMSGSGGLTKLGGGTLVVSGKNTFSGGTLIQGGVVRIDSGSSLGTGQILLQGGMLQTVATLGTNQQVLLSGNAGVDVATGTSTELSGTIAEASGNGCFVKSGAGRLNLSGNAILGSGTCVAEGMLAANGVLASSFVQVNQGATLRGIGAISGPVTVDGKLAPGASPGTLVVSGDVRMSAASTMQMDIDGLGTAHGVGNYSRLLVVGAGHRFFANGVLQPLLRGMTGSASNTYTPVLGTTFRIVTADGGVVGRFSSIAPSDGLPTNARFVAFYGVNNGNSIDLRVAPLSYAPLLGDAANRNALNVAGALDSTLNAQVAGSATAAQSGLLYAVSSLGATQVAPMVASLGGEVHADQAAAARVAGLGIQRDVADHLGTDAQAAAGHQAWANVTRDGNRTVADGQGSGFDTGTDRTSAGIDLYADGGTVVGVGASHHDTSVMSHGGRGNVRGNAGMLYAQQQAGRVVLDGIVAYGSTDWLTHRADPLGGASIESRTSGKDLMASTGMRFPIQTAAGNRVEPYASVIWQKVERDATSERGGSLAALSLDALSQTGTRILAGVALGSKDADPLAAEQTWRAGVAVGADTGDLLDPTVHNTLAGQRFETAAPEIGRGFVQLNANGTVRLAQSTYVYVGLNAEVGKNRSAYGITGGLRVAF